MILLFPFLHRELVPDLPDSVITVNPGLAGIDPQNYTPPDLPLDSRAAKAYLAESVAYGESFATARDMAAVLRQGGSPLDPESGGAIRSGLVGDEERARKEAERKAAQTRMHAQAALLFAWALEDRLIDFSRLDAVVDAGMDKLRKTLGLDEDDLDDEESAALASAMAPDSGDEARLELIRSWRTVLRAMSVLVPEARFLTTERAVRDDLAEEGVTFAPCPEAEAPATGALVADVPRALLWKGAGEGARPEGAVRVYFVAVD